MKVSDDKLEVDALRYSIDCNLYSRSKPAMKETKAYAIPYYKWANRGENEMRVFMPIA